MLNKLEFNNLVITNKKIIHQARSQTIAKVVQKLRKVKRALEKQPDNEENKARQRKNVEYIAQLKTLKQVDIMRALLLKDGKKHKAVLTNGRATPDEVVIAMLGLNKLMQVLVAEFKLTLKLSNDSNANWREEIMETSKRRQKLERTEEKRRKRKETKELKAQSRNRKEWLEKNKPKEDVDNTIASELEAETIVTDTSEVQVKKVESMPKAVKKADSTTNNVKPKKGDKVQKPRETKDTVQQKVEGKQKVLERSIKTEPAVKQEQHKQPKVEQQHKQPKVEEQHKKPKVEELHKQPKEEKQQKKSKVEKQQKKPKVEEKQRPTHVVDPFFITESGQPYLSTAVVMSDVESDNEEYQPEQKRRNPAFQRQEHTSKTQTNGRPMTTNYQGKKTKFAEDGSTAETITVPPPSAEISEVGMHPSWIAKQKLKPKIAAFQGTKIKFDD